MNTVMVRNLEMGAGAPKVIVPILTMSMGQLGVVSRVTGDSFGSCATFGAVGQTSAPGQIPVNDLHTVLHILHEVK